MKPQFIQALYHYAANRERVDTVVIHTMETGCVSGAAQAVALGFQREAKPGKKKSAHYCVDPSTVIKCVLEKSVAWHCPKLNRRGIGIEHAGRAFPSPDGKKPATDWSAPLGESVLRLSAALVAGICIRWGIPVARLTKEQILAGEKGIVGHADASIAFGTPGGHRDPGPDWPWDKYLAMVSEQVELQKPQE